MANPETIVVEPDPTYYTADMVRALNDAESGSTRYECVYGALLVTPGPSEPHQFAVGELFARLRSYVSSHALGAAVYVAPADITWDRDDVLVQPDVFVVPSAEAREAGRTRSWDAVRHLLLAVEVVSPSSRRRDRFEKRRLYQSQRVPEYWVVDPNKQLAEEWTPELHFPLIERERLAWHPDGAAEPLVIALADLFAEP